MTTLPILIHSLFVLLQATGGVAGQPPIFDSLLDTQRSSSKRQGAPSASSSAANNNAAVEVLPLQRPVMDFSAPALVGVPSFAGSPLALASAATRSSSSMSGSGCTKRPSSPATYAHHRRKRGRPPRHSYTDSVKMRKKGAPSAFSTPHQASRFPVLSVV